MYKRLYLIGFFLVILTNNTFAGKPYSFGIVPQQATSKLIKTWLPIFKYLETETGIKTTFSTAKNIPAFEKAYETENYDFIYMNPYHYINAHESANYQAIAKARDKKIKGIVVVKKDSTVKELSDLSGQTLAFPSPNAFAASMLPRAALTKEKITFTPKYVSSHDSVYKNIAAGHFMAGGGVKRTFNAVSPDTRKQLKILWTSNGYTPHAFAVHPRVPNVVVEKIQTALIKMEQSEHGKALLKTLKIKGIEAAKNSDWDDIRALNF